MQISIALLSTLTCFLAAIALCAKARSICSSLNLMDVPNERKKHVSATPLMGGMALLAVFIPIAAAVVLLSVSDRWVPTLLIWLGCVFVMALTGIADDRHSLSPRARLFISFVLFAGVAAFDPTFNVRVLDFEYPRWGLGLGAWWLAIIFTVICCVGLINAINMADGKNGLVISLALGWLGLLACRAPADLVMVILPLMALLAALLMYNLQGRLFLGDGGSYGLATAIGLLAIMIYNTAGAHALRAISADELVVLFAVPVLDSFRLTYVRLRQGRSPMSADRDHLHHHLQDRFGWPGGLAVYLVLALLPGTLLQAFAA